jgi:tetratricopeptide (TPR) repeat protein
LRSASAISKGVRAVPGRRSAVGKQPNLALRRIREYERAESDGDEDAPVVAPLQAARRAQGWSQARAVWEIINLAKKKGMTVASASSLKTQLSRWENGHVTPDYYRPLLCQLYQKNPHELGFMPDSQVAKDSPSGPPIADRERAEDIIDVLDRIQKLHRGTVHPEIMHHLQDNLSQTVERCESLDYSSLVPSLLKQRGWIESLLNECSHPGQRRQLCEIAGVTSGVLGYAAADRGEFPLARAYCLEAFQLGDFAGDSNIKAWARGLQSFCEYYVGRYDEALTLARDGLNYVRQGPQNADLAINGMALTARSFLASACRAAGDLAAAAPLHQRNLADCERVLGADHPETLVARANLAYLYALQDQPARALELHERNLTDYQRVHGLDHPHVLNACANLASCYRDLGDLPRAIELHQQSVADYARVFGTEHSETITARSNLAYAYQLAGDLDRAIPLHRQVLTDRERLNGLDHLYTKLARRLLATAHQSALQGKTAP